MTDSQKPDTANDRPRILLLGPARTAVSGVSSHLNMLLSSALTRDFELQHFQIGSEGRDRSRTGVLRRLLVDPVRLLRTLRKPGVAAVHVNSSMNARAYWRDLCFLFAARLARKPAIFQVHGGALPGRFFHGNRLLAAWLRWSLRLPAHIVVLGSNEAEAWQAFLPGQRVHTIPNAIDCGPWRRRGARPAPVGKRLRAVYLGRLADGKGLCELLHGLASPALAGKRPQLVVAGSGPERAYLQTLARDLKLESTVEFVGPVFDEAKNKLLASADLFVLPSYSEGLPYSLLEAMAAGAVPVTTPVGAIPDVVENGVHGLYVPPRDSQAIGEALLELHRDRDKVKRMSFAARERALRSYDIRRLERDFHELYGDLAGNNDLSRLAEA